MTVSLQSGSATACRSLDRSAPGRRPARGVRLEGPTRPQDGLVGAAPPDYLHTEWEAVHEPGRIDAPGSSHVSKGHVRSQPA
jgi:hypothetical protein